MHNSSLFCNGIIQNEILHQLILRSDVFDPKSLERAFGFKPRIPKEKFENIQINCESSLA